jgi:hypothetical protein
MYLKEAIAYEAALSRKTSPVRPGAAGNQRCQRGRSAGAKCRFPFSCFAWKTACFSSAAVANVIGVGMATTSLDQIDQQQWILGETSLYALYSSPNQGD